MHHTSRYYVVWRGRKPGVYSSWAACREQVEGFEGAMYKAYPTLDMARRAFQLGPEAVRYPLWALAQPGPQLPALAVDAASSQARGPVVFRGVWLRPPRDEIEVFREHLPRATANAGEFLAVVRGLQWLQTRHPNQSIPVYTDSRVALSWLQKGGPPKRVQKQWPRETQEQVNRAVAWLTRHPGPWDVRLWDTAAWGENPADFGRK